ncbi:MAG: hypothetical protein C0505_07445 [Leptothrix sp. (in: Bacteria)]|nr:hypothetical protein [Leptothrix sp. (in: b-proteobacteria)]
MPATLAFDALDTRILAEPQAHAWLTLAGGGRREHLSRTIVAERARRHQMMLPPRCAAAP